MGKVKNPCCYSDALSIFFGGTNSQTLYGIKSSQVNDWLKSTINLNFKHIRKEDGWNFGFVHFENKSDKVAFFNFVKDKSLTGPNDRVFIFKEAKSKDDDDLSSLNSFSSYVQFQTLPAIPPYNVVESEQEIIIYILASGIDVESFEVEVDECNSNGVFIKFKYQDFNINAEFLRQDFIFQEGEVSFTIHLGDYKNFDTKSDPIILKHYGIVQISLKKHISPMRKRYKLV